MAKPVVITADSTCDMSPGLLQRYCVKTLPLYIIIGEKNFKDGVDIFPDDIYRYYQSDGILPKTAAIPPLEYKSFFESFINQGFDVVHLNLSSKISATHQNALIAASELEGVYPVDTLSLCTGMALLVIKACELRDSGCRADKIAQVIKGSTGAVNTSFILNKLEYLSKGGRCSMMTAMGANLLGIKPCIEMVDGELFVGKKYRGKLQACYEQYAKDKLQNAENIDLDRVIVTHSGVSDETVTGVVEVVKKCADFNEILIQRAGCTITSHCGPDTLAVIFMTKK